MADSTIEILLVEDNKSDAILAIKSLKKHNLAKNLVHLTDGVQALEFIYGRGDYAGRNIANKPNQILNHKKVSRMAAKQK
jgi:two-component system response regulator